MEFTSQNLPGYIHTRNVKIEVDSQTKLDYTIQFADKNYISHSEHENRKYHSVIFSEPEHKLLSVFPKISYPYSEIIERYSNSSSSPIPQYSIQEIVEGIRLHMFYDERVSSWMIATRRVIGGDHYPVFDGEIIANSTYKQMFLDAVPDMFSPAIVGILSKNHCYHFVLQHPKLPETSHILTPSLYLIDIYVIDPIKNTATIVTKEKSPFIPLGVLIPKYILIPLSTITDPGSTQFNYSTVQIVYSDIRTLQNAIEIVNNPEFISYNHPGWYIRTWNQELPFTDTFECFIENAEYKNNKIRNRTNTKYYLWKYISLLKKNAVNDFIRWNPYFEETSRRMYHIYNDFQKQVYSMYLNMYVKKIELNGEEDKKTEILKSYATGIHHLVYLPRIRYYKKHKYPSKSVDARIKMKDIDKYMRKINTEKLINSIGNLLFPIGPS